MTAYYNYISYIPINTYYVHDSYSEKVAHKRRSNQFIKFKLQLKDPRHVKNLERLKSCFNTNEM